MTKTLSPKNLRQELAPTKISKEFATSPLPNLETSA